MTSACGAVKTLPLRQAIASVVLAAMLLGATGCRRTTLYFGNVTPPGGNTFRFVLGSEPEFLDPARIVALYDARLAVLLFEGLTSKDPETLAPRPGVAERWDISSDGRTYTFHLRPDARWSDGQPVTAQDFIYSWTRVLDPGTAAAYASYLYCIVNAEAFNEGKLTDPSLLGLHAPDDHTLVVQLTNPVPYFLYLTAHSAYYPVPRRAIAAWGDRWTDVSHFVGNGPFRLLEHRLNDRFVLERNTEYWNWKQVRPDRVIAYSVDNSYTASHMYEAGMVDWLPYGLVPPDYLSYMRGRFRDLSTFSLIATMYYGLNTGRHPLDNVLVRRALSLAIDRRAITDNLLHAGDNPTAQLVPGGIPGYPAPPPPAYDPARAAQLLAEAGYPNGRGFPSLEILVPPMADRIRVAEAIQQSWAKNLNLHFSIHQEEFATFLKRQRDGDYDIASTRWIGDYLDPSTFTDLMQSSNANNWTDWKSPQYDRLLAQAAVELDSRKRMSLLEQGEALMLAQAPVIPLYNIAANELVKPYVHGIFPARWDVLPLNQVWIDHSWKAHNSAANDPRGAAHE